MTKKINIAVDGHSSCGKGTLAKFLASELNYAFVDTGAMYRAVTYALKEENIDLKDSDAIKAILKANYLSIHQSQDQQGQDLYYKEVLINDAIRLPSISNQVSQVSELEEVRTYLVNIQQEMAIQKGVVMDGRDIGTHVLPNAELKIFMTADVKIRAQRRFNELQKKKVNISFEHVYENILFRDKTDSSRDINPLVQAKDARVLNNSNLDIHEQNKIALDWVSEILSN